MGGLSPRRRVFVVGVAVVVLVLGLVVTVRVVGGGASRAAGDRPGTVLLVPGYGGGTDGLRVLADRLRAAGRDAVVVDLPGDGTGDLAGQARALDRAADRALRGGAPSVDVVGHSAGGVVARLWVRERGGAGKARRIVTLGTPHRGVDLAAAGLALAPGACRRACQELAPGSALLRRLGDRAPGPVRWTSVWSERDETVPPASSPLAGAVDVDLQRVCADARTRHAELPSDPLVTGIVLRALGDAAPPAGFGPADCAALRVSS
ncbi:esterase/lipase family protein [Actinomadura macrotermitis]|nr:alpha/beta fold hydrolase [Actinomadura macrotermitis]